MGEKDKMAVSRRKIQWSVVGPERSTMQESSVSSKMEMSICFGKCFHCVVRTIKE